MGFPGFRKKIVTRAIVGTIAFLSASSIHSSCNESLPPYAPPANVFTGSLQPEMLYSAKTAPVLRIYFTATNTFQQTLQGHGNLTGTLRLVLANDTSYHKTFALDSSCLVNTQALNPRTGLVTVDPGGSLLILVVWDFTDDDGRFIPGDAFPLTPDPNCPTIGRSDPQPLTLTCSFRVFDLVGQVVVEPVRYDVEYRTGPPC